MRLLRDTDVIKAVDRHTREDGTLDEDISVIIEEVETAFDRDKMIKDLEKHKKLAEIIYHNDSTERHFGESIAYQKVIDMIHKCKDSMTLEEVELLFGKMRETTKEEQECIDKYLKDISKPTGVNLFDYLDKIKKN